jgi:hypothetical protein
MAAYAATTSSLALTLGRPKRSARAHTTGGRDEARVMPTASATRSPALSESELTVISVAPIVIDSCACGQVSVRRRTRVVRPRDGTISPGGAGLRRDGSVTPLDPGITLANGDAAQAPMLTLTGRRLYIARGADEHA